MFSAQLVMEPEVNPQLVISVRAVLELMGDSTTHISEFTSSSNSAYPPASPAASSSNVSHTPSLLGTLFMGALYCVELSVYIANMPFIECSSGGSQSRWFLNPRVCCMDPPICAELNDLVTAFMSRDPCGITAEFYANKPDLAAHISVFNETECREFDNGMIKGGVLSAFYDFDRQIRGTLHRRLAVDEQGLLPSGRAYSIKEELHAVPVTAMVASDTVMSPVLRALAGTIEQQSQEDTDAQVQLCIWAFVVYSVVSLALMMFVEYPLFRSVRSTIYFARCSLLVLDEAMIDSLPEAKWLVKHSGRVLQDARHDMERLSLWRRLCQFRSPRVGLCALPQADA